MWTCSNCREPNHDNSKACWNCKNKASNSNSEKIEAVSIHCPVCQNTCSSQAVSCPKCGHPFQKNSDGISKSFPAGKASNVWKPLTIIGGLVLLVAIVFGGYKLFQNQNGQGETKSLSSSSKPISFRAALLYKIGAPQPVARTKFYLLSKDLKVLDKDEKVTPVFMSPSIARDMSQIIPNVEHKIGIQEKNIKDYIVATTVTDFEGNAKFENVPPGVYSIVGFTTTRSEFGYVVWSVPVDSRNVPETILLDQNNAFEAGEY
jgi:hypothetical protein